MAHDYWPQMALGRVPVLRSVVHDGCRGLVEALVTCQSVNVHHPDEVLDVHSAMFLST